MARLVCCIDAQGNIKDDQIGFYDFKEMKERDDSAVMLENKQFPKEYRKGHYLVEEVDGKYYLIKKSQEDIDAIPKKKTLKDSGEYKALMALDPNKQTASVKVILEFLQKKYG